MNKATKTYIYRMPLSDDLGRTLVRTGVYADGNCFVHALLTAIDPKYRKQSTHYAHLKVVREFRKDLAEWVTAERFQQLGQGEQLRIHFLDAFNRVLDEAYAAPNPSAYEEILRSLVSREEIDQYLLPEGVNAKVDNFYVTFCRAVDQRLRKALRQCSSEKVQAMCTWAQRYFVDLFEKAHTHGLEQFRERLTRMGEWVDALQMECIARYTGYNFVFIREQEGDVYPGLSHVVSFDPTRQCLVFLWVGENHFEIIGDLEKKNIINRVFSSDDPLIRGLTAPRSEETVTVATPALEA
jgi:hypothetical protein